MLRGERCTEECIAVEAAYAYNDQVSLRDLPARSADVPFGRAVPRPDRTGPGRRSAAGTAVTIRAAATGDVVEIDAAAEIGVRNTQPHGIGRVVVLGDLTCWNNLGRNVVFADGRCRPRAVFGRTLFPGQDEPSQYDLDIHAILDLPDRDLVLVLNHLGCLRGFRRSELVAPGPLRPVEPLVTTSFAADVERTVLAGTCLVGIAARATKEPIGVLVSAPIEATGAGRRRSRRSWLPSASAR